MTALAPEQFVLTPEIIKDDKYSSKNPDPIDVHVGNHLRTRRTQLGMSQQVLANEIGITFQQVQKYENGSNRVAASRLLRIAYILSVPVSYFYEGISLGKDKKVKVSDSDFFFKNSKVLKIANKLDRIEDAKFLTAIEMLTNGVLGDEESSKQQNLF